MKVSSFFGSFAPVFLLLDDKFSFSFYSLPISSLSSVKQSPDRVTVICCLAYLLAITWSSGCQCFDRRCCHLFFKLLFSWNIVPITINWHLVQNPSSMSPLEFMFPTPCFSITEAVQSLPTYAFMSPRMILLSSFVLSKQSSRFS